MFRRFVSGWWQATAFTVVFLCLYSVAMAVYQKNNSAADSAESPNSAQTAFVAPQPNIIQPRIQPRLADSGFAAKPASRALSCRLPW